MDPLLVDPIFGVYYFLCATTSKLDFHLLGVMPIFHQFPFRKPLFTLCLHIMLKMVFVFHPLCRLEDVGKPKAEVAAKRVMERVNGVNITPHFCRIEDKPLDFYSDFSIIVLGLDSIEARSYINSVACSFLGKFSI